MPGKCSDWTVLGHVSTSSETMNSIQAKQVPVTDRGAASMITRPRKTRRAVTRKKEKRVATLK